MTSLFKGMMKTPAGKPSGFFSEKARDILNTGSNPDTGGFDLLAWNINRGRDHGLKRKSCYYFLSANCISQKNPHDSMISCHEFTNFLFTNNISWLFVNS